MTDSVIPNIAARLDALAERLPDKPAILFPAGGDRWKALTYGELRTRSDQVAWQMRARGLVRGTRAALMVSPGSDFAALALGMLKVGVVPVLVDPAIGLRAVGRCLKDACPEAFIGNSLALLLGRLYRWGQESVRDRIDARALLLPPLDTSLPMDSEMPRADAEAAIIFTSGSTGAPKGAIYAQRNFAALLDVLPDTFGIREGEIDLPAFPIFLILDCLLGVTAVVPDMRFPSPARTDARKVMQAARRFHVTNMFASPVALERMAAYASRTGQRFETLERVITAGAPAPARVLEAFSGSIPAEAQFLGIYGATEALIMSVVDQRQVLAEARHETARGAGVCIGQPLNGACIRILPVSEEPVAEWDPSQKLRTNCVGEITVMGAHVSPQYTGGERVHRLHKIAAGAGIVHRTGDLGYFDDRGRLWYCGRKAHRVTTAAGTMFTEQIEGIFNAHPQVHRTALVGWRGEPVLWIELAATAAQADKSHIVTELREMGRAHPQARQIGRFLFCDRFPADVRHNSKIIRERLAVLAAKRLG